VAATDGTQNLPRTLSLVAVVSGWESTYDDSQISAYPYASLVLEASLDGTNFVPVGYAVAGGDGNYKVSADFPAAYARASLATLDDRITAITVTAYVGGG